MGCPSAEKSPARCSLVGTCCSTLEGACRIVVPWYEKKKNVQFRPSYILGSITGPPTVAPNWFRFKPSSCFVPSALIGAKKFAAFNELLRRYSNALPCREFVPERVIALTMPPTLRPNSAENVFVCTLNSWSASGFGIGFGALL